MEMIMSTISSTAERSSHAASGEPGLIAVTVKRLCAAYVTWRRERSAIAALRSMSERELIDIGLVRSEIDSAVRIMVPRDWPRP
jgi:uncharacterized protein YjiS (DUF1127 family)